MSTRNLLTETVTCLAKHGKTPADVHFVRNGDYIGWWEEFALLANHEYDSGFGMAVVNRDLRVVGDDWWMERHEYDGSEWWEFKRRLADLAKPIPLTLAAVWDPYGGRYIIQSQD